MDFGSEEARACQDSVARYSKKHIGSLFHDDSADGDLALVPSLLETGYQMGILASSDEESPGYYTGAWGRHVADCGPRTTLMMLEEMAYVCGGMALNYHAAGMAQYVLSLSRCLPAGLPRHLCVAASEGGFPPGAGTMRDPGRDARARINTVARTSPGGYSITGAKHFVHCPPATEAFLVFARADQRWEAGIIAANSPSVRTLIIAKRMGMRACPLVSLDFLDAPVTDSQRIAFDNNADAVMQYYRYWWLGLVAIGAGIARHALDLAVDYARQRYQGCTEIIHHPAIAAFMADCSANIRTCQALLDHASQAASPREGLLLAAQARLSGHAAAAQAVTDALQIFGGYGYMEDYKVEKCYRDIFTLKNIDGGARDMKMLIADLMREV